jgi:hypothetical protein
VADSTVVVAVVAVVDHCTSAAAEHDDSDPGEIPKETLLQFLERMSLLYSSFVVVHL